MDRGTPAMVRWLEQHYGRDVFHRALEGAEPGNFSEKSWNYWHLILDFRPTPLLPRRAVPPSPYVSTEVQQEQANTYTVEIAGPGGAVKWSFFGGIDCGQIRAPDRCADNRLKIASAEDLLALKLATIHQRIEAKDYLDIHALLRSGQSLPEALGHLEALHPQTTNWMLTLQTLVYFKGGDLDTLPAAVKADLEEAVRKVREVPVFPGMKTAIGTMSE